ncbi:fatty acid hydroxylase [Bacteroidetes/Chlorobi group bacterium Naka2016]|jgi:sterol desaturase/sphingolipid hydroxylase (fatty acid hydroxylase superfamily)|nr:MAG: fatty acid hydroxylase [Bacteroidetes/Chlorobi group bacterium Naka2016]
MSKIISNEQITPRLFNSNFLEFFSKVPWYVPLAIYVPVVFYILYISLFNHSLSVLTTFLLFLFGIVSWTFVEYLLHRFVFHYQPKTKFGERLHFIFHGIHHSYPRDPLRLVMPPSVSIPLAFLFYFLFEWIFPNNWNLPFYAGFVVGYLVYDTTHYAIHHFPIKNKFFLKIKSHHMKHHYSDENTRFGVSSPLWDYVFGTVPKK